MAREIKKITEFELRKIINQNVARIEKSVRGGEKEIAEKGIGGLTKLDDVLKKGPKQ